jgi:hypothetical protein
MFNLIKPVILIVCPEAAVTGTIIHAPDYYFANTMMRSPAPNWIFTDLSGLMNTPYPRQAFCDMEFKR